MKANHFVWPGLVMLFVAALALPSQALADDDDGHSLLLEQLTQFNGGCPPNPVGVPGGCYDPQFSVHRAPVCANGPNAQLGVGANSYSFSMVREFAPAGEPNPLTGGSSTLVRASDGVAFNLSTTDLAPNAPYTVWFVGFNPGNDCINEVSEVCTCGEDDIDSVFWAAGAMSDLLGSATFVGNANYGELPNGEDQVPFDDFAEPLQFGAEIHFVIRAHGPALTGDDDDDDDDD